MEPEERILRERMQTLHDKSLAEMTEAELNEVVVLKATLIKTYGWARGKALGNNRYDMLVKP